MFRFGRPRLRPLPDDRSRVFLERRILRMAARDSWEPELQRVRKSLPAALHDKSATPNGRRGLWCIIATAQDVPIGLAWSVKRGIEAAHIEEVSVLPDWQRRNIGSALVIETARWSLELGLREVAVHPTTGTAWVERLGFVLDFGQTYVARASNLADLPADYPVVARHR